MSNDVPAESHARSNGMEPIPIEAEEVTGEKQLSRHGEDVFEVSFSIESTSDVPLSLRLTDHHPDENGASEVGFHPDSDPNNWEVAETGDVIYETVIEPGKELETLYRYRTATSDRIDWVSEPPTVETRRYSEESNRRGDEGGAGGDGSALSNGGTEIPEGIARESAPPASANPERRSNDDAGEAEGETTFGSDENGGQIADASSGDGDSQRIDREPSAASEDSLDGLQSQESLVTELVGELKTRELSAEERSVLRDRLGLKPTNSMAVRLRHVQEKVDDLVAYRDALEEFIDENGEPPEFVGELQTDVARQGDRIVALEDEITELTSRLGDLREIEDRVESVDARLDSLEERHADDVERLEDGRAQAKAALEETKRSLEADLSALHEDVEQLMEWRERLYGAIHADEADSSGQ